MPVKRHYFFEHLHKKIEVLRQLMDGIKQRFYIFQKTLPIYFHIKIDRYANF